MARFVFFDARVWRYLISSIGKIIEEAAFLITPEGVKLRAMDPSHVVMVDLNVPVEAFEEYDVNEEITIGVNFEDLAKVLRRATKDDKLGLETLEEGKFAIEFIGKSVRKFVLPIISVQAESLPEPKLEFKANARMLTDVFKDMVKDLEPVGEAVELRADESKFVAHAKSDLGEAEVVLDKEGGSLLDLVVEEESKAIYSLDYFVDIAAAAQAADVVNIRFSTDMPCKIEYELPQGGRLAFYVAPRVE